MNPKPPYPDGWRSPGPRSPEGTVSTEPSVSRRAVPGTVEARVTAEDGADLVQAPVREMGIREVEEHEEGLLETV